MDIGRISGSNYVPSSEYAKASPEARLIADTSKDLFQATGSWEKKRDLLKDGLNRIVQSSGATSEERTIARLGINFGDENDMSDREAANARHVVVSALAAGVQGPMGQAMALLTLNASRAVGFTSLQRKIEREGLEAIAANGSTSPHEKTLAKLGVDAAGDTGMGDAQAVGIREAVLENLIQPSSGSQAQVISETLLDGLDKVSSADAERTLLRKGLETVANSYYSSPYEKAVAQLGITAGSDPEMGDSDGVSIRRQAVEAVRNPSSDALPQALAKVTLKMAQSTSYNSAGRKAQRAGLDALVSSDMSTYQDRILAKLGQQIGSDPSLGDDAVVKVRNCVLQEIASGSTQPLTQRIARACSNASVSGVQNSLSRALLRKGFEFIINSGEPNPTQRTLAQMGIEAGSDQSLSDGDAARMRRDLMDKLASGSY